MIGLIELVFSLLKFGGKPARTLLKPLCSSSEFGKNLLLCSVFIVVDLQYFHGCRSFGFPVCDNSGIHKTATAFTIKIPPSFPICHPVRQTTP
ncbi:MAG: hypothetical protein ACOVQH_03665, partial [Burkholderiaceae bacterium]